MSEDIRIETLNDGNLALCRDLCNELMAFQKASASLVREAFDGMNFDTRMKKSYKSAERKQALLARDHGIPVGYVFSTMDTVDEKDRLFRPDWAPGSKESLGFYPDWLTLPRKIGCLNNLYVRDSHRGTGLGSRLFSLGMDGLESFGDCRTTFVYISNGNDDAYAFYMKNGFAFSHDVFGGFIKAACKLR